MRRKEDILEELYNEGGSSIQEEPIEKKVVQKPKKEKTIKKDKVVKEKNITNTFTNTKKKFDWILLKIKNIFKKEQKEHIVNVPKELKEKDSPVFFIYLFIFLVAFFLAYSFNPYILLTYYDIKHTLEWEDPTTRDTYNFSQELAWNNEAIPLAVGEIKEEHYDLIRRFYKQKQGVSVSLAWLDKDKVKIINAKPNLTKIAENKLELPFSLFVAKANKIVLGNGKNTSSLIYRDLKNNIQKELVENSVISFYHRTPIIFSHSSWGSFNFWLFFLWLKKGDKIKIEGVTEEGKKYIIPIKIDTIVKDIPGKELNSYLGKIEYNNNNIILDTCELDWTKRRILIATMEDIQFVNEK